MTSYELNMDGLVGPTHHYAGLSPGNMASTSNALSPSNPQAAARQGLAKMRLLHEMGLKQGVMPPHQRPNLQLLQQLGFSGSTAEQLDKAYRTAPELLSAAYSASSMWTANAATVSSSLDCADHRVHFTAANLVSNLHRHQEADFSKILLNRIFSDKQHFCHHDPLPRSLITGDEGAANHNRLSAKHNQSGLSLFVYGKQAINGKAEGPHKFPARQTLEASQALARSHQLDPSRVIFACQNPEAIDLGVFHNDVISVANESVFIVHEQAFLHQAEILDELQNKADFALQTIIVSAKQISIADAVKTYLFNSQLLSLPNGSMVLIAPSECETHPAVKAFIDELLANSDNPIMQAYYLDLKQSMRNGGGPACLRLRIPLNENEIKAMQQTVLVDNTLLNKLDAWVLRHYRDRLEIKDLRDPKLIDEVCCALDELSSLLQLGSIYPFQLEG